MRSFVFSPAWESGKSETECARPSPSLRRREKTMRNDSAVCKRDVRRLIVARKPRSRSLRLNGRLLGGCEENAWDLEFCCRDISIKWDTWCVLGVTIEEERTNAKITRQTAGASEKLVSFLMAKSTYNCRLERKEHRKFELVKRCRVSLDSQKALLSNVPKRGRLKSEMEIQGKQIKIDMNVSMTGHRPGFARNDNEVRHFI